ncbi:citrate synthase family protein [Pseudoduganella aquatica]|uniref:citryl-CoA lyase n=1 Tax=Pseudoduganella aquatica TaxID=2660641 RepID=UPI001E373F87|nr:citryl-CoA lyase [Pseudoduganella aquatica]
MKNNATPSSKDLIHTAIWQETPEADNPFATRAAYCRGYDVYGAMAGNARWMEMLWLLLRAELPAGPELDILEALAVALANPGPRDASVHAAMCGGVGGSTAASSLMAALAVGAGRSGGAREVHDAMTMWKRCGADLAAWRAFHAASAHDPVDVWPEQSHLPGFDPHGAATPLPVRQLLATLDRMGAGPGTTWLHAGLEDARAAAGLPLAMCGVAACVLHDLGFSPDEGEMLYLLLRLPGAAAHALEQKAVGFKRFPFYKLELDPAATPPVPVSVPASAAIEKEAA